jgi:hypothetical protein
MKKELPLERMCISDSVSNLGDTEKAKKGAAAKGTAFDSTCL